MTQVAERLQPWLAARSSSARKAARAGSRTSAIARRRAVCRARVPDRARRGVAFHQHRADCAPRSSRRPARTRSTRPTRISPATSTAMLRIALVVVNGRFVPDLSRVHGLPPGVRVGSLAAAVTEQADVVQRYLGQLADFGRRLLRR